MKNVADIYPLTPTQAGILFHTLRSPEEEVYFQQISCTLEGQLDITKFQHAWDEVVKRHPPLRTIFLWEGVDEPLQVVRETVTVPWEVIDLRGSTSQEQIDQLDKLRLAYRERGFNLTKAPILHMVLARLADERYVFIWNFHHILTDGWSTHQVFNEAFLIYEALVRGEMVAASPVRPFRDYINWLMQQDQEAAERYWVDQLKGFDEPTPFQVDKPPQGKAIKHGEISLELSSSTSSALQQIAKGNRVTLNTLILGAWGILLSRYSGDDDVVFGTTLSGRPADLRGVESMIGMLINTLPLRIRVKEDDRFLQWLQHLQENQLKMRQYEYSSLAEVQRWSEIPPGQALFDSIVVFENYPVNEVGERSLQVKDVHYREQSNYPLALLVSPRDRLRLLVIYDQARFDPNIVERLLSYLHNLLAAIVENTDQKLGELSILDPAEIQQILFDWNETAAPLGKPFPVHEQISEFARQTPDKPAVATQDQTLTYAELDILSNQLAHHLIQRGAAPGTPIGLFVDRSLAMIVGIVGILKAGCPYVPLDPAYPAQRIEYILNDTQAPLVITQPDLTSQLNLTENKLVNLDDEWSLIKSESTGPTDITPEESDLVYIIYTSGSTGEPKGVMVTHGNLINSTAARNEFYNENVGAFLLLSSFSFDSSIAGIFWTLCSGGKLVLPPMRIEQDILQLAKIISDQEVTHTLCLPSLYMILLDLADTSQLSSLQTIIVAGEACQPELVSRHFNALPQAALYNEYGPTETTVWSTAYRIPSENISSIVPIGRPIPNVQNYILDRNRRPVPIGIPGELCIGGAGVTVGYLNDPQNTALKFIELSFDGEPVQRIYQTGDRARYLPDGNIEFLGRVDQQVKIRGNRVELGEIENVLRGMPSVEDAVVVLRKDRLAAYIILGTESEETPDWRGYLATYLADFMIPESFSMLEEFPQTPNGKIDRNALPDPEIEIRDRAYIAPRSATEKLLADIWMDVLDIDQVGVEDNFFEIGGNSLLSIRIFSRITEQFEVKLPLSVLFTEFTLERLAAKIELEKDGGEEWSLIVPIQPDGEKTPFFCIHGLTGDILWFRQLGKLMAPDQPFYGIQARGLDGITPAIDSINEMASTYLHEIKKIQPDGPYILGGASLGGTIALEMAQQLETQGEEVALLVMFDHSPDKVDDNYAVTKSIPAKGMHLAANSIQWAQSMRELGGGPVVQRVFRKARLGLKKLNGRSQQDSKSVEAADLLDYGSDLPDFRKRMIETHWHAINNYMASAYQNPVLLFQAKSQPLLSTRKPEDTWLRLATGQLTIISIPGSHEGMFKEPHVHTLARMLRTQIELVQDALNDVETHFAS